MCSRPGSHPPVAKLWLIGLTFGKGKGKGGLLLVSRIQSRAQYPQAWTAAGSVLASPRVAWVRRPQWARLNRRRCGPLVGRNSRGSVAAEVFVMGEHTWNTNPMRVSPRCRAETRAGTPCQAPAARGKRRCRMHGGATGSGAPKGNQNALKHGLSTRESTEQIEP
jgi:glucans biosynthesis protein